MSARWQARAATRFRLAGGLVATATALGVLVGIATGAPPTPCNNSPQISDASQDGHHPGTDLLSAWASEAGGRLQVVMKIRQAGFQPEHDDGEVNVAGFAYLFTTDGQTRFVRGEGSAPDQGGIRYEYGTWTRAGGFAVAGATTGEALPGTGGTMTIDVPAETGASAGVAMVNPFVLTYDGVSSGQPHWVDRGPGGVSPDETTFGADYVVGSCGVATPPGGGDPTTDPVSGGEAPPGTSSSVELLAPGRIIGGGPVRVTGRVLPARAGVAVELARRGKETATSRLRTEADGSFAATIPVNETTQLRALAEGLGSQTLTVTVKSRVRLSVKRLRGGGHRVIGRVRPRVPGRVLLLRTTTVKPTGAKTAENGSFAFQFKHLRRGRYQAVFIPSGARAERSTSNTGVVK